MYFWTISGSSKNLQGETFKIHRIKKMETYISESVGNREGRSKRKV
jgi:hypothetical protein